MFDKMNEHRTELLIKNDELQSEVSRLRKALDKLACWDEGKEVTSSFDSPWTARIARDALKTEGEQA